MFRSNWETFLKNYIHSERLGISFDFSGMNFDGRFFESMASKVKGAYGSMCALEAGEIANVDENRQVGHYWLRNPNIAPTPELQKIIRDTISDIVNFAGDVHSGNVRGPRGTFKNLLCIGIGGSALGPQLINSSLGDHPRLQAHFIDNTDPDGIDRTLSNIELEDALVLVTSKSGSTPEPRNAMLEVMHRFESAGISFPKQAVAVTSAGSKLHNQAMGEGWIKTFPMLDWIGGRTSITSSVGLLPGALIGVDVEQFLSGAREMDSWTRIRGDGNPAMRLALAWYFATDGHGTKDMVVIPYKDRLVDFPKYLQQLIMESLGKEKSLDGTVVNQGISVYGNKGSTDQHSYVQQLRDGIGNFFLTIIEVLQHRDGKSIDVEDGITAGDYLHGFSIGTEQALSANDRQTLVISLRQFNAFSLGLLIALYERAVGFYASLIGVNAYNQPGVEAGKKAAANVLNAKRLILEFLRKNKHKPFHLDGICDEIGGQFSRVLAFKILEQMSQNYPSIERGADGDDIEKITYKFTE
ncbi:MAG: glucose-6-phosphate isomerase [Puniceicoccales bacterium]|jgi:glucose-6-phosphate isomerase|nr:glucose-6-phosphate isomerase [Puniceicoccales bacterium]